MHDTPRVRELLREFERAAGDPLAAVRAWKQETGGRAVACIGLHVPEEIISAAGMLPVLLLDRDGPLAHADGHVQNNMCGYIRSVADQALAGELACFDALAVLDSCHVIRMVGDSLRHSAPAAPRIEFLALPVALERKEAPAYLAGELASFLQRMEALAGRAVTGRDLSDAIRLHNACRQELQRLYQLRRERPGVLGAVQAATIVKAAMCMPKDRHRALLAQLNAELALAGPAAPAGRPVLVSGSLCEGCDEILAALEESGATVVDDDLFVGSRYFATAVEEAGDPLAALASAYARNPVPCPTVHRPGADLGDYLDQRARAAGAQGVVSVVVKYCEPHYYAYLMLRRKLRQRALPEYMVEKERDAASLGQLRTRLQAFVEGLEVGETA